MSRCTDTLFWASIALSLGTLPSTAMAARCPDGPYRFYMAGPPEITVDPSVPNNTTFWTGDVSPQRVEPQKCFVAITSIYMEGTTPSTGHQLYASGIPGISFRLKSPFVCYTGYWPGQCKSQIWSESVYPHPITLELVKTGPITGGGKLSGEFARRFTDYEDEVIYSWSGNSLEIKPTTPTCNATQKTLDVPLEKVSTSIFTGVGSTSPEKTFAITLECSGGVEGVTTNLYMTMTDQTAPANRTDQLSLAPSSTASGVAIQVLNGTQPVRYGPDSSESGNENQWPVPNGQGIGNQRLTIPLSARFIQTQPTIVPGFANGHATFTLSYR
ncbi:fimbrial protein [Pseudomonas sp. JS3066]|uniref:fimbrial protein n=1 Tax=unclassified Pseudomonas TaxID=196821 RepID=UPI0013C4A41A|nr:MULTISPECIES: fimbrial protein [unclassified Pseudomonas]WVK92968.1 fimbrial protein [Pseudomonas sp. JS3066]